MTEKLQHSNLVIILSKHAVINLSCSFLMGNIFGRKKLQKLIKANEPRLGKVVGKKELRENCC